MICFRHFSCESELIRYVGDAPTMPVIKKSSEWLFPDGDRPLVSSLLRAMCPDCGTVVPIRMLDLVECDAISICQTA